jgi:hypothetical protein
MEGLPDDLVAAVGHVTIAAGDLELVLATVAAHQADGDAFAIMAKPGEPLRAARGSVQSLPFPYQDALSLAIEDASVLLSERHAVVHAMWINHHVDTDPESWELLHFKTHIRRPASAEVLEGLAVRTMEVRNRLVQILTAYINSMPVTWTP